MNSTIRFLLCGLILLAATLARGQEVRSPPAPSQGASGKPVYYPTPSQSPLRVGEEDYRSDVFSLHGLTALHLNIDEVLQSASARKLPLRSTLKAEIIQRLTRAGINLIGKDELANTPGQPTMNIYLTFPAHLMPPREGQPPPAYRADCCMMSIWTSFIQGSTTLRDPLNRIRQATWGKGDQTTDCSDLSAWTAGAILKVIDSFVAAKLQADKERAALTATPQTLMEVANTPATTGQMECNTSLMMYLELFATGAIKVSASKLFVLDKLASAMKSCPNYGYIIETHADQRSDSVTNRKLTVERAESIRSYLISKGVLDQQFELRTFGSTRLATTGTSQEDYAANRRVVVTPYKIKAR